MFKKQRLDLVDFNILTGEQESFDFSNPFICYGKGSSGGTNTVEQSSTPPPQVMAAYQTALNAAQSAASAPLQQYGGPTIAGFTPDQTAAFGTIDQSQGIQTPYLNSAQSAIQAGQTPLWSNTQQFSPNAISQYSSPYTSNVLNTTMAAEQNQDAQQQAALKGNAVSSGAWGGDRAGVASAILSGQQDIANNATNANIENTGYNTALGEFNTEQQSQLGANEANAYLNEQAGFGLAGLGSEAQSTALTGANAQLQSGALQQQLGQEALNVPYENFLQQQAYPFQTAQYFANIAEGLGGASGGTSTGTSTAPAPSTASQLGGLGLTGLAGIGASGGFGSTGWLTSLFAKRGGRIQPRRYDSGGGVPSDVPNLSISYIPQTTPGHVSMGAPKIEFQKSNQQQSSPLQDMQLGTAFGKLIGNLGGSAPGIANLGGSSGGSSTLAAGAAAAPAASDAAGGGSSTLAAGAAAAPAASDFFSFFGRGGVPRKYDIGGQVLPDVVSGVGDIVGAFFGDPGAGDQGVQALSILDNGKTGGEGIEGRTLGSITGNSETGFKRGGLARHFDVGGVTPMGASTAIQTPNQQTNNSSYQNMNQQQLQQLVMRLPAGSPQAKSAAAVLQQKRMMPNVGTQPQGGFGMQQQQVPSYGGMAQQPVMARGGRLHFDSGGDIPPPPTADELQRAADLGDLPSVTGDISIPASALQPPPGGLVSKRMTASAAPPPPPTADELQRAADLGDLPSATGDISIPASALQPPSGGLGNKHATASAAPASAEPGNPNISPSTSSPSPTRETVNPWLALAETGMAIAGGTSPYAITNIGRGAMAGIQNYGQQQKEADTVNEAADRLVQEAQQHKDQIAIEQQNADTNRMALKQKELVKDAFGNPMGWADPTTGTIKPIQGAMGATPQNGSAAPITQTGSNTRANPAIASLPPDAQERLSHYPPQYQSTIVDLIQGRIPADRMHLGLNPQAFLGAAADVDPTFDIAKPSERMKTAIDYSPAGNSGKAISQLDYASKHAAQLALASLDLNNTSTIPLLNTAWNTVANKVAQGSGDPRVTNFQNVINSYAPEVTKFISGKTNFAEKELEDVQNAIPQNGSLAQQLGAISQKNGMMLSRANTMQQQYDSEMGPYGQQRQVLRPETKAAFDDMDTLYRGARDGKMDGPNVQAAIGRLKNYSAGLNGQTSPMSAPSPSDISYLKANPAAAAKFDAQFGQGASQQYLGQQP